MVNRSRLTSWLMHLKGRRGKQIINHTVKMFRFHMTPFSQLLSRILETLDEYDAKFTFPLVAATAQSNPSLVEWLGSFPHEIAIHGYKHIKYSLLSLDQQVFEFKKAIRIFKELKIPYQGFRAPYNAYSESTIELVEKFGFKWDGGIGYRLEYRYGQEFFKVKLRNGKKSSYTCIPLCEWSDDRMIDKYRLSWKKMAKILIFHLEKARKVNGLVMYDLHPIRIGQREYIRSLSELLLHARNIGAWIPTVSEAVDCWSKDQRWKGDAPVCCLLTGDIDNFTFFDYMRRT
ncbi:MAG: polysaccharide deacetylase family protein [Candidatus Heimdallarchaeota archaeon]|nr:MAG: polysaccharide deacetylase family protein [Candidatus Heimdallarchaeota archaeon]